MRTILIALLMTLATQVGASPIICKTLMDDDPTVGRIFFYDEKTVTIWAEGHVEEENCFEKRCIWVDKVLKSFVVTRYYDDPQGFPYKAEHIMLDFPEDHNMEAPKDVYQSKIYDCKKSE